MSKLESVAPELDVRKLGRPEAVASQHSGKCIDKKLDRGEEFTSSDREEMLADLELRHNELGDFFNAPAVYIGTTHAWLSG